MRPAFSSIRSAIAFALLLLLVLLSPVLVPKSFLPSREQCYTTAPWTVGGFPNLQTQLFHEKESIDIAFMGSSPMWWAVDAPYVQQELSKKLGRPAVVRVLGWSWHGYDAFYFIAQDLLRERKVRMIVFSDLSSGTANTAHPMALHWFRLRDNWHDLPPLPLRSEASFYSSAILGMPRSLLSTLREDSGAIPMETIYLRGFPPAKNPATRLGSFEWETGDSVHADEFTSRLGGQPEAVTIYSPETAGNFEFSSRPLAPMQSAFAARVGSLARTHGVQLTYLEIPRTNALSASRIEVSAFWPQVFQTNVTMLGIPATKFFASLSHEDATRLYFDYQHLNQSGQRYFTRLITPSLIQIYENQTHP